MAESPLSFSHKRHCHFFLRVYFWEFPFPKWRTYGQPLNSTLGVSKEAVADNLPPLPHKKEEEEEGKDWFGSGGGRGGTAQAVVFLVRTPQKNCLSPTSSSVYLCPIGAPPPSFPPSLSHAWKSPPSSSSSSSLSKGSSGVKTWGGKRRKETKGALRAAA